MPVASRWITRSHTGKLWLNDPCSVTVLPTSGLMSIGIVSGDQPTLVTWPPGFTSFSAASSGRLAPDASHTRSAPSGSRLRTRSSSPPVETSIVCVAPSARAASSRGASCGSPATISGLAPASAAIRAHSRPIGPGPKHDHQVARMDRRVDAHRLVGDGVRLAQAGVLEGQRVGDRVQAARRRGDVGGHRAVDAVAEALAGRAQVVAAGAAHQARAADHARRSR